MAKVYKYCYICGRIEDDLPSFGFPKKLETRKSWLKFCNADEKNIQTHHKLCLKHFDKEEEVVKTELKNAPPRFNVKPGVVPRFCQSVPKEKKRSKQVKICLLCDIKDPDLSYFIFPKDVEKKKEWLNFCKYPDEDALTLKRQTWLCEKHFNEEDIIRNKNNAGIDRLRENTLPSIFFTGDTGSADSECKSHIAPLNNCNVDSQPELELSVNYPELELIVDDVTFDRVDENQPALIIDEESSHANENVRPDTWPIDITFLEHVLHDNCDECSRFKRHLIASSVNVTSECESEVINADDSQRTPTRKRRIAYVGDVSTPDLATPKRARRSFNLAKTGLLQARKKIDVLNKRVNRLQKNVDRYSTLVEHLTKKGLLSENAAIGLLHNLPTSMQQLIERQIVRKNEPFPQELRAFAITLQFYSADAYQHVRSVWNNLLPHESTLRKWYSSVDGSPGFTSEAFRALKSRTEITSEVTNEEGKKTTFVEVKPVVCALVVDEMSIKKHTEHDRKQGFGYQDLGTGLQQHSDIFPCATHSLVFLLVSLKEKWKIPVGYFLIHSLSGNERANLIKICLEKLHEVNAHVVALTFDGTAVNLTMCTTLGASFDVQNDGNFHFPHPTSKEPIYIYPDPCHMLKLVRNAFGDKGPFFKTSGEEISWQYILNLHKLEDEEGLRAATKLTKQHVQYHKNKMNVKLAAQVLSDSVKSALLWTNHDLQLPEFKNDDATAEFCGMLNNIFDTLNCRSRFSKRPYQMPVQQENLPTIEKNIAIFVDYLKKLLITKVSTSKDVNKDGKVTFEEIVENERKMGFVGLIICLKNLIPIHQRVSNIPGHYQPYLLSYKLLQDSIENFFCAIRSRGGFNNNPTARSFEWAYKRLLVHHEIRKSGNCELDDMEILNVKVRGVGRISTVDAVCKLNESSTDVDTSDILCDADEVVYGVLSRYVVDLNEA